jgi:hypothetical protein
MIVPDIEKGQEEANVPRSGIISRLTSSNFRKELARRTGPSSFVGSDTVSRPPASGAEQIIETDYDWSGRFQWVSSCSISARVRKLECLLGFNLGSMPMESAARR